LGEFRNGERYKEGEGVEIYFKGSKYEGKFIDGMREGFGKMTHPNGDVYEGQWENG